MFAAALTAQLRLRFQFSLVFIAALCPGGCGYKVKSAVGRLPAGISSIGIPIFQNSSPQFRIEQKISSALLQEFTTRTRLPVTAKAVGVDAVLKGEIRNVSASPVTFATDTFGSAFLITVQISVKFIRTKDSSVIWQDDNFFFRERYVLNSKVQDFFLEENPALDRLAREFAASLAGTLLSQ